MISLLLNKWVWIALALAGLTLAVGVQTHRLSSSQAETKAVQASFDEFRGGVESLGRAQEAKNRETVAQQKRVNDETVKSADARVTAILDRYNRLLNRPVSAGSGGPAPLADAAQGLSRTCSADYVAGRLADLEIGILGILKKGDTQIALRAELLDWLQRQGIRAE